MKECDHILGELCGVKTRVSTIKQELEYVNKFGDKLTPKYVLEQRCGYMFRYIFCPVCGIKLNWKSIIKNIRE